MRSLLLAVPVLVALPALGQNFPQSLRDYLQLTASQIDSIGKLNLAYDEYAQSKLARLNDLQNDIARLTVAEPLEPMALGQDYVELETIQRDLRSKNTQLLADNAKVLTDAQRIQIKSLADAQVLQPVLSDATCQNLPVTVNRWFDTGAVIPGTSTIAGGVLSGIAVGVRPAFFGYCAAGNMTAALATYLALAPAQLDGINRLNQRYVQFTGEKQSRIAQVQTSLADLMAAPVLDPAAIGTGYAEIEAINRDLRDKLADLRGNVAKVLTSPQTTRVKALDDVNKLQPVITAARCESLLAPVAAGVIGSLLIGDFSLSNPFTGSPRYCY